MTVVTDTSVVLNLCVIGQQEVLPVLYGRILAPPIVAAEFQRLASSDSRFRGLTFPLFIEQAAPTSLIPSLATSGRLQAGEVAALSLAVELRADVSSWMNSRAATQLSHSGCGPLVCSVSCWTQSNGG